MTIAVGTTRQLLAQAYTNQGAYISLHTGDPGATGTAEASGGSYARQLTSWSPGTGGIMNGTQTTLSVNAATYNFIGIWSAATGGVFVDKCAITPVTLSAPGQLLVTPSYTQS